MFDVKASSLRKESAIIEVEANTSDYFPIRSTKKERPIDGTPGKRMNLAERVLVAEHERELGQKRSVFL
jgi:hypothetical protein